NAAVTFARLGKRKAACVSRIGAKDTGGQAVLADLRRERVDTAFVQRDPRLHTGYSIILLAGSGERTILVHRGASEGLVASEIPWMKLKTRWFYVTSLGGDLALFRKILNHAERIGARVAWNPGSGEIRRGWKAIAPLASRCTVFNVNREEAAQLTRLDPKRLKEIIAALGGASVACEDCGPSCDACEAMAAATGPYLLLTDGSGGAYVHAGGTTWHIASRKLTAVNTTGAGDAFGSAFSLGLDLGVRKNEMGYALDYALRLAMANAEGVITHMGAKAGILSKIPSRTALAKYRVRELR
ncbi:carbohydrate kinase family protein, partial [Candidatus Uhrbacteria bacterium]|nr:carbohydrate kinase family protein [Candidatus Uhrbacteria bacterium]